MKFEKEFEGWLMDRYPNGGTSRSRMSNCRRVEKNCGDLGTLFEKDRCEQLLSDLTYSTEDERSKRTKIHNISINGNIRNGSATLKAAVRLYVEFSDFYRNGFSVDTKVVNPYQ